MSTDPIGGGITSWTLHGEGYRLAGSGQKEGCSGRKVSAGEKQPLTGCSFLLDTACSELLLGLLGTPTLELAPPLTSQSSIGCPKYQSATVLQGVWFYTPGCASLLQERPLSPPEPWHSAS